MTKRQRISRKAMALIGALSLALLGVVGAWPLASAHANPCVGTLTNVRWDETGNYITDNTFVSGADGQAKVKFDWAVDADASPGDTFNLTLPNELQVKGNGSFNLTNGATTVATGAWNGKTIEFTLTDYADDFGHITGSAFFTVEWDRTNVDLNGANYNLNFTDCKTTHTLQGRYLPEGPSGVNQQSGKTGVLDPDGTTAAWAIYVATAKADSSKPLSITDLNGDGYQLSCDSVQVYDRTPPPHTEINDTPIDAERWSCTEAAEGGITIVFNPISDGRYLVAGESLMITFDSELTPLAGELDEIVNVATIKNGPMGDTETVTGKIELPTAGGEGSGFQATFNIEKQVKGTENPDEAGYVFEYKCRGDQFIPLAPITAGETTSNVTTKSAAVCTIREASIANNATVSFVVEGADYEALPDANAVRIHMAPNVESSVHVVATNTFEPTKPTESEQPTTTAPAETTSESESSTEPTETSTESTTALTEPTRTPTSEPTTTEPSKTEPVTGPALEESAETTTVQQTETGEQTVTTTEAPTESEVTIPVEDPLDSEEPSTVGPSEPWPSDVQPTVPATSVTKEPTSKSELPRTGVEAKNIAMMAILLGIAGTSAIVFTRRRSA